MPISMRSTFHSMNELLPFRGALCAVMLLAAASAGSVMAQSRSAALPPEPPPPMTFGRAPFPERPAVNRPGPGGPGLRADRPGLRTDRLEVTLLAALQPQKPDEGFTPISELPPEEKLPAAPMLVSAYVFVALALFAYMLSLSRRLNAVGREIDRLDKQIKR